MLAELDFWRTKLSAECQYNKQNFQLLKIGISFLQSTNKNMFQVITSNRLSLCVSVLTQN